MSNASEEMKHLHKLAKRDPSKRFDHLWELAADPAWLMQAWEEIRSNKGSMTAGIDSTIATDIDPERIQRLSERLKTGKYRPKPVRRVYIAKSNGKMRPLGIPTLEDRIVQQALRMLMEPIFEADFHTCSHGFRRNRSTHTALRDVARAFQRTTWTIEGDIVGCFDNIPHGKLMKAVERRIADRKVLGMIRAFLAAGYMEQWVYHNTYSGTPQGGVLSPLLCNIFLHQLDEYLMKDLKANKPQSIREENARRNPEYRTIESKVTRLRRKLRQTQGTAREAIIKTLTELERQQRQTPRNAKDKRHPSKVGYARYADDFVIMVQGKKEEAQAIKDEIGKRLQEMGLALSEEKTKLTHWRYKVNFLGYQLHGKRTKKGTSIRPILSIPREKVQRIKEALRVVGGYHHVPEIDAIVQMSAMYRGWCNYYRYANGPQATFNDLASFTWWQYAHYVARKHRLSTAKLIRQERQAGRYGEVKKNGRIRKTFRVYVGKKAVTLDLFPPRTGQIRALATTGQWTVDLKPVIPMNWPSGRSLATRKAALERAQGICERCGVKPVAHVHHTSPLRRKSFLARVMSDRKQRETAQALCQECHVDVHGGSYTPRKRKGRVGLAGCAERCLSGLGRACAP
jgi:group II intron reverse transcriptase/maturase